MQSLKIDLGGHPKPRSSEFNIFSLQCSDNFQEIISLMTASFFLFAEVEGW